MPGDGLEKASKFMSFVLRHRPDEIGLDLDKGGWASLDDLVARSGGLLNHDLVREAVVTNEKQRFALSADGKRIRASQGHSVPVDLGLVAQVPPIVLYHGTATRFLDSILQQGLLRGGRHHVHLSPDPQTALAVGARHGKPAILEVAARKMHERGVTFFVSENGVWLTDHVPPDDLHITAD